MKTLVIALDPSSLQPPVDDRTACQILPYPLDLGLLRVSASLSVCAQKKVCVLAGVQTCTYVFIHAFFRVFVYFLDNVYTRV